MASQTVGLDNDDFVSADLDGVNAWDGAGGPVPKGDHVVEVTSAERKPSKAGNPMLALELTIVEGPAADRKLYAYYVETGNARKRLKAFLEAAKRYTNGGYSLSSLKGARLIVNVDHEEYEKVNVETMEKTISISNRVSRERAA